VVTYDDGLLLNSLYQLEDAQNVRVLAELDAAEENLDWEEEYEEFLTNSKAPDPPLSDLDSRISFQGYSYFTPEDPMSPIFIPGQSGSGRKGKNKTHEEYAAAALTLGWGVHIIAILLMETLNVIDQERKEILIITTKITILALEMSQMEEEEVVREAMAEMELQMQVRAKMGRHTPIPLQHNRL
jgi:hypothetical protein